MKEAQSSAVKPPEGQPVRDQLHTRRHGRILWLAWAGWITIFLLVSGLFAASLPYAVFDVKYDEWQVLQARPAAATLFPTYDDFVTYILVLRMTAVIVFWGTAIIIAWRKPKEMFEEDDSVFAAMRAGARGYVLKGADQDEMLRAIRAVARGEALFGAAVAARLQSYFAAPKPDAAPQAFPDLTRRERDVLELLAQGRNNEDIARQLHIAQKTVRNHCSNIFSKMQVVDRSQAIVRAREAGIGHEKKVNRK